MKIKKIMLVTLMLLAVLTIGAVSATDDVSSGNLTVADGTDNVVTDDIVGTSYDPDSIYVYEDEEICIDPNDDENYDEGALIADITLPENAKGSFRVYNGDDEVSRMDFEEEDEGDTWEIDDGDLTGWIYLNNFNLTKVNDGDILSFQFWELINGNYKVVESLTQKYSVKLTDTTIEFISADGMTEDDVNIQVKDVDTTKPNENFIFVNVTQMEGVFIIEVETDEDDPIEIFYEDLSDTTRTYDKFEDEDGNIIYGFAFSLKDLNDYIVEDGEYNDLTDLIETLEISDGYEMYFNLYEDDEETVITERTFSFTYSDGKISFVDEDVEPPVEVDYLCEPEMLMEEGWQDFEVITFTIKNGITGRIVILLNDNETPAFNKTVSELTPDESDEDDEFKDYTLTIRDLNITGEGRYVIRDYFYDNAGNIIYQYDDEDPETFELIPSEVITDGNVTFVFNKKQIISNSTDTVLTIGNVSESGDDVIVIYVDDIKEPIKIMFSECESDDGNYTVPANKLGILAEGTHSLNVSCQGCNAIGTINITSKLTIDFPEKDDIVYTTFNDAFVFFTFNDDIDEDIFSNIKGKLNITIKDVNGNLIFPPEMNIEDLIYDSEEEAYVIKYNDIGVELNGKYTVVVKYFEGNEGDTQNEANVTFQSFDPNKYGASIKEKVYDKDENIITFTDIPLSDDIFVEIDGNNTIKYAESYFDNHQDEEGIYYIKIDNKLKELTDGTHSIRVYIDTDAGIYDLASGNIYVDLVENIDPALTVSVDNITEGADAVIVITTNTTFSGDVQVKIANTNYTVSVTNGLGNYSVSGLAAGTYNVTAIFKGNAFFNESTKNTTFTVNPKVATAITAPALTTTYATSKNLVVTLKDANGNPLVEKEVTVSLNGASKTLKTNAKGQVSYAIGSKLAPKTYSAEFKFAGDSAYLASAGTVKVTVKKAKAKMTAKKKTFKAKKKTKKYSIVLKTDKGKALKKAKVTLKVKGKKYTAKTNSKGKAVFKIKKLTKKGKYKAKVKFAGNKYYNKLTKKVKIKVKK